MGDPKRDDDLSTAAVREAVAAADSHTTHEDDARMRLEPMTDGGVESIESASGTRTERLRTLFVDVTGTDEVVVEQNVEFSSRDIDDDSASISAYVDAVTKDDGLTDTIDHPELDSTK